VRETPAVKSPRARGLRYVMALVLMGVAVHVLVPQIATAERSIAVIRSMAPAAVAFAAVTQLCSYLGSGLLVQALVAVTGQKLALLRGTEVFTAAVSVGLSGGGPAGSVAASYHWLRCSGVGAEGAALAASLPTVFYDVTLAFVSVFGLIHLLIVHELSALQAAAFGLTLSALLLIAALAAWGARNRPRLTALVVRLAARWAAIRRRQYDRAITEATAERWFRAWDTLRTGGWRGPLLGAALNTVFDMLTLYLLFVAVGHAVSPGVLLAGYGLPLLLSKVTFLPGGVGIVEGTMAALYNGLGVPGGVTVVVVLTYRLLSFWLPLVAGLALVPYLQHVAGGANCSSLGK